MKLTYYRPAVLGVVIILALISPIKAMIEVKWTVRTTYEAKSTTAVVLGKVAEVDNERFLLTVALTQALKGKSPAPKIRIQITAPQEFIKQVAADKPLVFIQEGEKAFVHVSDTWLLAMMAPNSNMLVWRVVKIDDTLRQSFPGRTAALVQIVTDLATGKDDPVVNKWEHKPFAGGMKQRAKLAVKKPTWILAEDVNGDKKPDLLIGSASGIQLFLATADGYTDATAQWGALGNAGAYHAFGDVDGDGKLDLLLDGALFLNQGKFAASKAQFGLPKGKPLAAALLDVTGDQKPDALFLDSNGELRIFENPGAPDKPWTARPTKALWTGGEPPVFAAFGDWGDTGKVHVMVVTKAGVTRYALDADGGAPSDFTRLTGTDLAKSEKYKEGLKNAWPVALQMSGESRPDLFMFTDAGTLLLLNRGLGAYFMDETAAAVISAKGALPLTPTSATPWTRANLRGKNVDDLLVISEDGTLYELDNAH